MQRLRSVMVRIMANAQKASQTSAPMQRLAAFGCTLLVALCISTAGITQELPDIGSSAGTYVSPEEEAEYRNGLRAYLRKTGFIIDHPLITDYIETLGFRLVVHSDDPDLPFEFHVLSEESINAFAAPGGFIAIHSGLILTAESESELAAVMAHEIAHITQAHLARGIESSQKISLPILLGMLGAALAGGGELIEAAVIGGSALMQQARINYTRANEYEADRLGIRTLSEAGYDPLSMATMFERMGRVFRSYGRPPSEYLSTHPVTANRVAEAKNRAEDLPSPKRSESKPFYLIRAALKVDTFNDKSQAVAYFTSQLESRLAIHEEAARYGLGLAYLEAQRHEAAYKVLAELVAEEPESLFYQLMLARAERGLGQWQTAFERYAMLHDLFPRNAAVIYEHANALTLAGGKERSRTAYLMLRDELATGNNNPLLLNLASRAADGAGDEVDARQALAEYQLAIGKPWEAVRHYRRLAALPTLDYYERARVNARLAELERAIPEEDRHKLNKPRNLQPYGAH